MTHKQTTSGRANRRAAIAIVLAVVALIAASFRNVSDVSANHSSSSKGAYATSLQSGETIYAITTSNRLVQFSSADPCTIISEQRITGLQGESLLGIDFRPATGQLYGLGSGSRLYTINLATGVATPVGTQPFTPALEGSSFGFDFNPVVDRIRVVSDTGQNLRLHPDTGAVVMVDGDLAYAAGDANAGSQPSVVGAAYTNPDNDRATGTTLYDIDSALNVLTTQNPPNSGTLNTVGSLGVNTNDLLGFDISSSGVAYAALKAGRGEERGKKCGNSMLVTVNLATGDVTVVGNIGSKQPIRGLAVLID